MTIRIALVELPQDVERAVLLSLSGAPDIEVSASVDTTVDAMLAARGGHLDAAVAPLGDEVPGAVRRMVEEDPSLPVLLLGPDTSRAELYRVAAHRSPLTGGGGLAGLIRRAVAQQVAP